MDDRSCVSSDELRSVDIERWSRAGLVAASRSRSCCGCSKSILHLHVLIQIQSRLPQLDYARESARDKRQNCAGPQLQSSQRFRVASTPTSNVASRVAKMFNGMVSTTDRAIEGTDRDTGAGKSRKSGAFAEGCRGGELSNGVALRGQRQSGAP